MFSCWGLGEETVHSLHIPNGTSLKSYKKFNELCQQICGGTIPTFLVTELFHPVATIKYIFPLSNEE